MKLAWTFYATFAGLMLGGAVLYAFQLTDSEPAEITADILLGVPLLCVVALSSLFVTGRAIRSGHLKLQRATLLYAGILLSAVGVYAVTYSWLIPANIRFAFGYPGASGTYHLVQFYFKHDGKWLEGPSVEAWPMTVRFPDLNGDGYPDIRVIGIGDHGTVDFVFLPQNDGKIFWRALKSDSDLHAAYRPAAYFFNYP